MKLYIVKYCANEFDDLGYDSPYPIYYSLDEKKARNFFEDLREKCIESFNEWIKKHPELDHNEDYQIVHNDNDYFEIYMGNWFYEYQYEEAEMETDLRFNNQTN